ncbi:transporter substrate-binding domain-containing protein [Agaribacter marinus]|uniref:Glutamine ABC transporter substrate-binding protein n=1 Tax=Virgibacillus salarius TaxID=447199 RepID=A0A941DYC1_9BACI|nr:glutamine ABC transporter substrate-binding protein [Virgibacillus salarius]MBR7797592.1 glutamine ABC transporter substrate-binding protein [Virgibacillus salarius]NAZ10301.1 transporter substrate-binding domain-containing protein [Agaribacter marinus]
MNSSRLKQLSILFVMLGIISLLVACGSSEGDAEKEGDSSKNADESGLKDIYTVASDTSFVPFEFKEDGEYVGFDIELIKAIADEVGFEIELETTNFDGIIPGLQTGSFDIAVAGISIKEDRKKKVDFSDPYYQSGLAIGVSSDNDSIKSMEDLEGKTIATRLGSTSATYINENIKNAKASQFEQLDQAYLAVENGSADAILYDAPNVNYYIKTKGDNLKVVGDLYQAEDYGIAISKGQGELVTAINDALATLKENGKYDEIYEKWFGKKPE